jgi:NAD-dependent dihydropyrimidine dehydrogenase PreA subunit
MRQVRFPLLSRLEMAVTWAFPISVVCGLILAIGWRHLVLPFVAMVWGVAAILFGFFRGSMRACGSAGRQKPGWTRYLIFFDPSIRRYLRVWVAFVVGLCVYAYGWGNGDTRRVVGWSLAGLFLVVLVSMDMAGSTPTYKSGLHEDRLLHIELDSKACKGRAMCWEVCPKNCYVIDVHLHKAVIVLPDACVQCGACVVQCPEDALAFVGLAGQRIPPQIIRDYKLNMFGQRAKAISGETPEQRRE